MNLKVIPLAEGYAADQDGFIYSRMPRGVQKEYSSNWRLMKQSIQSSGKYYCVRIKMDGKLKTCRVHRLICMAFYGLPENNRITASHIDGNWKNNKSSNLKWETYSENLNRKKDHGTDDIGVKNSRALINVNTLIEIRRLLSTNQFTQKEIGDKFNLSRLFITKIANGHRYKNQG